MIYDGQQYNEVYPLSSMVTKIEEMTADCVRQDGDAKLNNLTANALVAASEWTEADIDDSAQIVITKNGTSYNATYQYLYKQLQKKIGGETMIDVESGGIFYVTNKQLSSIVTTHLANFWKEHGDKKCVSVTFPKKMRLTVQPDGSTRLGFDSAQIKAGTNHFGSAGDPVTFTLEESVPLYLYNPGTDIEKTSLGLSYYPVKPHIDTSYDSIKTVNGLVFTDLAPDKEIVSGVKVSDIMDVTVVAAKGKNDCYHSVELTYDTALDLATLDPSDNQYCAYRITFKPKIPIKMKYDTAPDYATHKCTSKSATPQCEHTNVVSYQYNAIKSVEKNIDIKQTV